MNFTQEQLNAIDISRLGQDACIVAGPGSGKTTVLVERYRQLIATGVEPSEILAITYTEKAAANMRSRLASEFAHHPEMLRKLDRAYVSTIHGFCNRLLRENAAAAGVDPEFEILDEQLAVVEQAKALRDSLDALLRERPAAMRSLLAATREMDLERLIPGIYEAMRSAGVRPADLRDYPKLKPPSLEQILAFAHRYLNGFAKPLNPSQSAALENAEKWTRSVIGSRNPLELADLLVKPGLNLQVKNAAKEEGKTMKKDAERLCGSLLDEAFADEKSFLIDILQRFDDLYRSRKSALSKLDFNDLEFFSIRLLLDNPAIKRQVNEQFHLVMTDEFQDTSKQNSELIGLLHSPGRFYAVGDRNQSIYSFRHASPEVFEYYRRKVEDSGAHYQELVLNWRSREPILLATQLVLRDSPGITNRELVPAREFPVSSVPSVEVLVAETSEETDDYGLEAKWIVHRIGELLATLRIGEQRRPAQLSDFAILVRNTTILDPFVAEFHRAGIDYNLNRRSGFFETREARELFHLLRMIHNPLDETSTLVVLRSDFAGISDESLLRLKLGSGSLGKSLPFFHDVALDEEDRRRLQRFLMAFSRWRGAAPHIGVDRLVLRALDEMGIAWNPASLAGLNIEKFLNIARSYSSMTLAEFIDHIDSIRESDPREPDSPIDETRQAVQIMSTHAAKGLEFPVVILAALNKGVEDGRSPTLNFTPGHGLGAKWCTREDQEPFSGLVHLFNKEEIKETETAEANRLLYVAMTRAEELLVLSWTREPEARPKNWAKIVSGALGLDELTLNDAPRIMEFQAPDGKCFSARVFCASSAPPDGGLLRSQSEIVEPLVVEPPSLPASSAPNITATALSRFSSCPRKYYLGNYLGWEGDFARRVVSRSGCSPSESRASELGTQVHKLLAQSHSDITDLEAIQLAQVFERSALGRRAERARRRECEWDFIFAFDEPAIGELIVRGTIDLWFEDSGGITLVDYKTDEVTAAQAALRADDYELQLQVYALALERSLDKAPQEAWLHFLKPDIAIPVPLRNADSNARGALRSYIEAHERRKFPLNEGLHCRACEFFRNICPARLTVLDDGVSG